MFKSDLYTRKSCLLFIVFLSIALSGASCRSTAVSPSKDVTPPEGLKNIHGTQLYYKAMGKGQPIFFLHGRSGSHRYFLPYVEPLADEYQLLFYDQRGTGSSDGKIDLKAISIDQFVEDLEALRLAFGFEKISLMAHSSGTVIALFYAFKYQAHLDKLILVDPLPVTNRFVAEQLQTLKQRSQHLSPEGQQMLTTACRRSDTELSPEVRTGCLKLDAALRFYDPAKAVMMDTTPEKNTARNAITIESLLTTSLNRKQHDIDANLKAIRVPTLIIHGDFDPIPIGSSEYIQQHISTSQLIVMKQSGHFPFVEQPEQFVAAVRAFMRP
jgi:proline iminopeptidase